MKVGTPSPTPNASATLVELSNPELAGLGVDLGASWRRVVGEDMLWRTHRYRFWLSRWGSRLYLLVYVWFGCYCCLPASRRTEGSARRLYGWNIRLRSPCLWYPICDGDEELEHVIQVQLGCTCRWIAGNFFPEVADGAAGITQSTLAGSSGVQELR